MADTNKNDIDIMLDSDRSFVDSRAKLKEYRDKLRRLIYELKRLHPENCTPAKYAELRQMFIGELEMHIQTLEASHVLHRAAQRLMQVATYGMPDWSPELMEELSEGLGDEFKDL